MNSRLLKNNLSLKIISVIVAIILWLYAVSELNPETTKPIYDIPVEIINMDVLNEKNLTLAEEPEKSITVRIRGLANDIRKVNTSTLKAVLDLSEIDWTGSQMVTLDIEGLLPREVKLDKIPEIPVTINKITRKLIPVVVEWTGDVEEGYRVHEPIVEPRSISIYGAESLVDRVVQGVVQLNLDKDVGTIEQSILIKLVDSEGRIVESNYLNMRQSSALVTIPIYPVKTVAVRANVTGEPAEGFVVDNISVNPAQIEVNGYASIIENISSLPTEAVDIQGAVDNIRTTVNVLLENGVYLEPGQTSEVSVIVNISETTVNTRLTIEEIGIQNIPEGYGATVVNAPVIIQLRGPYTVINNITIQDLAPAVDLSQLPDGELTSGQYQLPFIISVPERTEVINISTETVTVDVQLIEEEPLASEEPAD
jgi:YbbR domain-containing protein